MAAIELSRGIERILPQFDPQKTVGLPENTNIPPEGERVTNYLETHFSQLSTADDLLDFVRPVLDSGVTAPLNYGKYFRATLEKWKLWRSKKNSVEAQSLLDEGIAILDAVEADMELLNDYVLCLQKV